MTCRLSFCLLFFAIVVTMLLLLGVASNASADVVVPPAFEFTIGSGSEFTALGRLANRIQVVYGASELTGLNVGDIITGLTFRIGGTPAVLAAPQTVANYEIRLSQSQNAPGSLSTTFADNRGTDEVVRSGPLTINKGDWTNVGSPRPFGPIIPFTTNYTYNGGPLLMEYSHTPFPLGGTLADSVNSTADSQFLAGNGFDSTTADLQNTVGSAMIVKFQVTQVGPGDFDGNLVVDGNDFLLWQRDPSVGSLADWEANYGTRPIQPGDFDGNGEVNGFDFLQWQRDPSVGSLADWEANYGTVATLSATSAAVPEPSTWIGLMLGIMAILFRRGATHSPARHSHRRSVCAPADDVRSIIPQTAW
jgi:hypothetical protein